MIALLVTDVLQKSELDRFLIYSDKIFTDNSDINYLDKNLLYEANSLENILKKNNISSVILLKKSEKIKLLNLENVETKCNLVCLTDKNWIIKVPRFFSNNCNKKSDSCQNIILTQDNKIEIPILDDELEHLKTLYRDKKYQNFVVESEKWIFHNLGKNDIQVMLRYYCGLIYYFKLGNIKKSLEHLGISIILNPHMPELWCAWGDILLDKKMYEKSKIIYKNAIIAKNQRNIFDRFPLWLSRNSEYPQAMHQKINESVKKIKTIKSIYDF
jgi:tetratricopeptide (TPR) repeat protein